MKKIILTLLVLCSADCFANLGEYQPYVTTAPILATGATLLVVGASCLKEIDSCIGWPSTCCVSEESNRTEIYNCTKFENPHCRPQDAVQYFCINKDDATLLASSTDTGDPDWDQENCLASAQNCCVNINNDTQMIMIDQCQNSETLNCTAGTMRSLCIDRSSKVLVGTPRIGKPLWGKVKVFTNANWVVVGLGGLLLTAAIPLGYFYLWEHERLAPEVAALRPDPFPL